MEMHNEPRLISLRDVAAMTSLSRTAINKYRAADAFPPEVRLGERRVAFVRAEVLDWVQVRIDARSCGRQYKVPAFEGRAA